MFLNLSQILKLAKNIKVEDTMVKKDAKSTKHSRYSDSKIVLNQEQHHHNYIYNNKNNNNSKQIHS